MLNRLFTLRSDRELGTNVETPVSNNSWPDQFDADFFAGTVRNKADRDFTKYDTSHTKWREVLFPLLGAAALATTLYFGVRAELAAENRKEAVESCVEDNLGVEIELKTNHATGQIIRPKALYDDIIKCEADVAGN